VARALARLDAILDAECAGERAVPSPAGDGCPLPDSVAGALTVGEAGDVVRRLGRAFADTAWTLDAVTVRDDLLLCHASVAGWHDAPYGDHAPTHRRVTLRATFVTRLGVDREPSCWCAVEDAPLRCGGAGDAPDGPAPLR
jgi:hypothetical protein